MDLRIIAGTAKGRRIAAVDGLETRPTLDRVREAVFGMIQFEVAGAAVLDLFAGSGAMGIEALSRGAGSALFCDRSQRCVEVIRSNLAALGFEAEVRCDDCFAMLRQLARERRGFDIVFLDPPYASGLAHECAAMLVELELLRKGGVLIVERASNVPVCIPRGLAAERERRYGAAGVTLLRME
ncbi:MAG: 16S rRNA (guanine(966)-N(2))-methyltransferase RsmD [Clostridia bacterium]|nr:16S rRNA (guanine(966)-N(2))-methyltransferase RsmD [Clostridia bacterium]